MPSVSQILRNTREYKGITLEDVARRTYIKLPYLEALEVGAVDELPAAVFVHGYIRQYAKLLGLNPSELVQQYQQEVRHVPPPLVLAPVRAMAENEPEHGLDGNGHGNANGYHNGNGHNGNGHNGNGHNGRSHTGGLEFLGEVSSLQPLERMVPVTNESARPTGMADSEEVALAQQQAQRIIAEAQREAQALKREADKYAHQVLVELEAEISRALTIVRNGRQFIQQRRRTAPIAPPPSPAIRD